MSELPVIEGRKWFISSDDKGRPMLFLLTDAEIEQLADSDVDVEYGLSLYVDHDDWGNGMEYDFSRSISEVARILAERFAENEFIRNWLELNEGVITNVTGPNVS